jgi:predicted PurR-regulated permease PerM
MTEEHTSPLWGNTMKLIVSLLLIFIAAVLIWQFQKYIGPLIFSFFLSYLLHPVANFLNKKLKISWRVGVTILYLLIFLVLIGLLTWGGFSLVTPLQNLLTFIQKVLDDVPGFITDLTSQPIVIGATSLDLSKFNNSSLWSQFVSSLSPALSKIGVLLGDIASGAANVVTMTIFTLIISYFITVESTGVRSDLFSITLPKYQIDIEKIGRQISRAWNSYVRGQLIIFTFTVILYTILLSTLGMNYAFGLAVLAGLSRFVPYVGPFVAWTTYGLVALFQGTTIFGLLPFPYALIVIAISIVVDMIMDNFVSPRIMSDALGVHPALVLISVLVAAKLIGFVGVLVAAPIMATLKIIFRYIFKKLTDQDPWKDVKITAPPVPIRLLVARWFTKVKAFFTKIFTSPREKITRDENKEK